MDIRPRPRRNRHASQQTHRHPECFHPAEQTESAPRCQRTPAGGRWISAAPDIILLLIGTNDLNRNNLFASAPDRFESLLSRLESLAPTARILVGSVPAASENNIYKDPSVTALNSSIQASNSSIEGGVAQHAAIGASVEFVDVHGAMSLADLGSDGLHFSSAGYDKLGSLWANAILAVPEPSTLALCLVAPLLALRRRR